MSANRTIAFKTTPEPVTELLTQQLQGALQIIAALVLTDEEGKAFCKEQPDEYTLVSVQITSQGAPLQYEGKLSDGRDFYARQRDGGWRIDIDGKPLVEGWDQEENLNDLRDILAAAARQDVDIQVAVGVEW